MSTSPHAFAGKLKNPTVFPVLWAASFCHLLNDMMQALLPAVYPILQGDFELSFMQVGLLTFVYQLTASILQPFIGHYTDRRPMPYSLPFGMAASMAGLLTLAFAPNYGMLLAGGMMLGIGSSIFHPESSRIARLASGGSHGLAQSLFQVGGNFGSALGPLAAALIVLPLGQAGLAWFALVALLGITVLTGLGNWYRRNGHARPSGRKVPERHAWLSRPQVSRAMAILIALLFSKYIYLASLTSYYTFYLMDRFGVSIATAQILQFVFFASVAAGTIAGGPIGDRLGRKPVIWVSILGVLPFTLLLPHAGLAATVILSVVIGLLMSSAFPAIVVYGQELMPGRVGMVSGLFFGFIFGIGGIGAALLGVLADLKGISFVFLVCSCLPVFGILTAWLPDLREPGGR
ncbi:MFS transporter (plasmid) [Paracoccus denitrificans]|uniref:MFS transporter n=1 Tax=Paracoccus denitrificans TaxID=266 RepID=UPI001E508B13|nr:MFS transporter [Paracoccus denitrificans]UFS68113.1 MFS transporter [Paracoccus denitrificans]